MLCNALCSQLLKAKLDLAHTWMPYSLDDSVIDVFPEIFERPFLFVYSNTKLIELSTYLAIGPQIYADGMLVFQQQKEGENQQKVGGGAMISHRTNKWKGHNMPYNKKRFFTLSGPSIRKDSI